MAKKNVAQVLKKGSVTSGWRRKQFGITYDTANRDLLVLMKLGLLVRKGSGPGTLYEMPRELLKPHESYLPISQRLLLQISETHLGRF